MGLWIRLFSSMSKNESSKTVNKDIQVVKAGFLGKKLFKRIHLAILLSLYNSFLLQV